MTAVRPWCAPISALVLGVVLGVGCGKSNTRSPDAPEAGAAASGTVAGGAAGTGGSGNAGAGAASGAGAGAAGSTAGSSGEPAGSGGVGGIPRSAAPRGTVIVEGTRLCAGTACEEGQVCCLLNGECVDADTAQQLCTESAPTSLPRQAGAPDDATRCSSNADCRADEYCENHLLCLGSGFCASRINCGESSGSEFCGCDGITYPNIQSACFAGTRVVGDGRCGQRRVEGAAGGIPETSYTPCASSGDCGDTEICCAITGRCIDEARAAVCAQPPEGSYAACLDNDDCHFGDLCQGEGCDTLGGCVTVSQEDCTGLLEPVCGCNGQSYTSAGCAAVALTRVADTAACPGTD